MSCNFPLTLLHSLALSCSVSGILNSSQLNAIQKFCSYPRPHPHLHPRLQLYLYLVCRLGPFGIIYGPQLAKTGKCVILLSKSWARTAHVNDITIVLIVYKLQGLSGAEAEAGKSKKLIKYIGLKVC